MTIEKPQQIGYAGTFGQPFTTRHKLAASVVDQVVYTLNTEVDENLAYDHWHPEIAGPLQMAIHYLQSRQETRSSFTADCHIFRAYCSYADGKGQDLFWWQVQFNIMD